jgi:hypothetical protein
MVCGIPTSQLSQMACYDTLTHEQFTFNSRKLRCLFKTCVTNVKWNWPQLVMSFKTISVNLKTNHPSSISKPNWSFWYYSHWKPWGALGHTVVDQFCPPLHPRHRLRPPCSHWMMFHHELILSPGLEAEGSEISEYNWWYMHTLCLQHLSGYIIMSPLGSSLIILWRIWPLLGNGSVNTFLKLRSRQ